MRRMTRAALALLVVALLASAVLSAAGCGSDESDDGTDGSATGTTGQSTRVNIPANTSVEVETVKVSMKDISFDPDEVTVKVGTKVVWTNDDPVDHTVTADDGSFDSGNVASGESYSFLFNEAGTYDYSCMLHPPDMKGTVIVEP